MDKHALQLLKKPKINLNNRWHLYLIFILLFISIAYLLLLLNINEKKTINVGVLFSQSGIMADSERPALRATLLAIEEINNKGGVQGHRLIPIVYDGASNWKLHAKLATKMIVEDHVSVIFGCFTSASRKEVKTIVEKYDNLLVYPVSYEGAEYSNNIIYLGMTPNQQLIPAIAWMTQNKEKKVYIVGSDYIYPRVSNQIIAHSIRTLGGEVIQERYIPYGSEDVDDIIEEIFLKKPDFIFSTVVGNSNVAFLTHLFAKQHYQQVPPIMSFGLSPFKDNVKKYKQFAGLFSVWSYYNSLDTPENKEFTSAYHKKYGSINEIDDPAATSYSGVYLWAQAVRDSPNVDPTVIRDLMLRQSIASPGGPMYIDPSNANTWRAVYIAQINEKGFDEIVWSSGAPIKPVVYLDFKTQAEWNLFEYQLYTKWGEHWEKT